MAHTLRSLAADKIVKKVDGFRAKLSDIKVVDGFNVRLQDDDLREHIAGIAGAIAAGLPIPPIEVWVNPETGVLELVDGHCRRAGYQQYAEIDPDFDGWVSVTKFDGTPAQRKARIVTSNSQLKLKPIELGRNYLSLRDEHNMSRQDIAREVGRSLAHVDQMILLASAKAEVIAAVEGGVISATEAVKLARDHGDDAPAELERRVEAAKEAGKDKVTAKVAGKSEAPKKAAAPSRPKVDFVVSCAVVLVNSLPDVTDILDLSADSVLVNTALMADLIGAVSEMQAGGKPLEALDAYNQLDLMEG